MTKDMRIQSTRKPKAPMLPEDKRVLQEFSSSYQLVTDTIKEKIGIIRSAEKILESYYLLNFFNKEDNPIIEEIFAVLGHCELDPENYMIRSNMERDIISKEEGIKWHDPFFDIKPCPVKFMKCFNYYMSIRFDEEIKNPVFFIICKYVPYICYTNQQGLEKELIIEAQVVEKYCTKFNDLSLSAKLYLSDHLTKGLSLVNQELKNMSYRVSGKPLAKSIF